MIKVGNQTNSQDPQAVNSRVFVGNLNTFQANKTDVEKLFQRYGRIAGISMHKGFAFVQFTNGFDARSSCIGEDGRHIFGQTLDVNMVSEPKQVLAVKKQSGQAGGARQETAGAAVTQTGHLATAAAAAALSPHYSQHSTRSADSSTELDLEHNGQECQCGCGQVDGSATSRDNCQPQNGVHFCLDDVKTYSSPDILICGDCRELFGDIMDMIEHKQNVCKVKFVCKCDDTDTDKVPERNGEETMSCSLCMAGFASAWDMMVHFQSAHTVNIYRLTNTPRAMTPSARDTDKSSASLISA